MYFIKLLLKLKMYWKTDIQYKFLPAEIRKIKKLKNKYKGQKAIIMCNGPSLNKVDFNLLKDSGIFCFGLNKINLMFDRTEFRPSAIVATSKYVIEQNQDFYNTTEMPLFFDYKNCQNNIKNRKNVFKILSRPEKHVFSKELDKSFCQGHTVTYGTMQIAYYLGFTQVALVGCDHYFATQGNPNELVYAEKTDPNHFDPRYFSGGVPWQLPDLEQSELHYKVAKKTYEEDDRIIYNCTDGGCLEVYKRMDLKDFINL